MIVISDSSCHHKNCCIVKHEFDQCLKDIDRLETLQSMPSHHDRPAGAGTTLLCKTRGKHSPFSATQRQAHLLINNDANVVIGGTSILSYDAYMESMRDACISHE